MIADLPAPCFSVEVRPSCVGEGASPGGGDLMQNQAAAEKQRAARKAQHKEYEIAKRH
jgi:hypothetical protein